MWISPKLFLDQFKAWINQKLVFEESANFYSVLSRGNSTIIITTFCIVCFEAVAGGLDDVSNNRLNYADVSGIRFPFNYNPKNWNSNNQANALCPVILSQLFSCVSTLFILSTFKVVISMIKKPHCSPIARLVATLASLFHVNPKSSTWNIIPISWTLSLITD